jgi:hypothetical protein
MAKLVARKLGLAVGSSGSAALVKLEVDLHADFLKGKSLRLELTGEFRATVISLHRS